MIVFEINILENVVFLSGITRVCLTASPPRPVHCIFTIKERVYDVLVANQKDAIKFLKLFMRTVDCCIGSKLSNHGHLQWQNGSDTIAVISE